MLVTPIRKDTARKTHRSTCLMLLSRSILFVIAQALIAFGSGLIGLPIAAGFLSLQHCFLPFIPDWGILLWRALMYLPFALYAGLMVKLRPSLLPYFAIVHALMDVSVLTVYLTL